MIPSMLCYRGYADPYVPRLVLLAPGPAEAEDWGRRKETLCHLDDEVSYQSWKSEKRGV